jgi:hypothetical protein
MFGYVKPFACSLSENEQALYKSIYCGLCHHLGEMAGVSARFTLSYDFVFLAALRMAATNEVPILSNKRCPSHPFRGCAAIVDSESLRYCAALSLLLGHENLLDKVTDEKGIRRFCAKIISIPTAHFRKKAEKQIRLPTEIVKEHLQSLYALEQKGVTSPEEIAQVFGCLLCEVASFGIENEVLSYGIEKIAFHLGKWIYLIDAADDYEKDQKEGAFNPFGNNPPDKIALQNALEWELLQCDRFLTKLPIQNEALYHILRNILFDGTHHVTNAVLYPQKKSKGDIIPHA